MDEGRIDLSLPCERLGETEIRLDIPGTGGDAPTVFLNGIGGPPRTPEGVGGGLLPSEHGGHQGQSDDATEEGAHSVGERGGTQGRSALDDAMQRCGQRPWIERFRETGDGPGGQCCVAGGSFRRGSQEDHGNRGGDRIGLECSTGRVSIGGGHHRVEQDDVRVPMAGSLQKGGPTREDLWLDCRVESKGGLEDHPHVGVIVRTQEVKHVGKLTAGNRGRNARSPRSVARCRPITVN